MKLAFAAAAFAAAALVALAALAACGGAAPPPLANAAGAPPDLLAFRTWKTLWQLRRDGGRAWLAIRGEIGDADYVGTQTGNTIVLRETCKEMRAELVCKWQATDIHAPGARMREGCLDEKDRWPAPGVSKQALVCEVTKGPFPGSVDELVFVPRRPVEETTASCEASDMATIIYSGYRDLPPDQARAALVPVPRRACPRPAPRRR